MNNGLNKIFIQIASYRDPQLIPTIENCIENANNPQNLRFGICWQFDETENTNKYQNDSRFKIIKIQYTESKGCCWARHKLQQLYDNEQYTLQLDSHHRFIKGWDTVLINMYNQLKNKGIQKPLITSYLPSYNPGNDPKDRVLVPWKIDFKEITADQQVLFIPSYIYNFDSLTEPISATFYSAHFAFTSGDFVKDVPHDPELYFTGEEMSITVRAFTYGYDLFHPHIVIAWHEYTRNYRVKQWDDDKNWWKKDLHSKQHYLSIFTNKGKYGIGNKRTIKDYVQFSGIYFLGGKNLIDDTPKKDDTSKELKIYKSFDTHWRNWIKENVDLEVNINLIKDILLKADFKLEDINNEINFLGGKKIIDEIPKKDDTSKEFKIYKSFDTHWRNWIKEKVDLEVNINLIKDILLKEDFKLEDINNEINTYLRDTQTNNDTIDKPEIITI
jgi:hypothetical protein